MVPRYKFIFIQMLFCLAFISQTFGEGEKNESELSDTLRILNLETAQEIALKDAPSLDAAADRIRQAKERVLQAKAAYLPRLDANGSTSRVWLSNNEYQNLMGNPDDPEDYYRAGLSMTWLLFDGFERKFRYAGTKYGEKETLEAAKNLRRLILSSVAASYFNAQLARENIAIAKANEAFNLRQAEDAKMREQVGTGSLSDVLNFEVQVNLARAELIQANQEYEIAMIGLAAIMGIPDALFPSAMELTRLEDETPDELILPDTAPLITYALDHRPDILKTAYVLKRADTGIGEAKSEYFPKISLSASFDGSRTENIQFEKDDFGGTLAFSLTYNLFDGGLKQASVREALAGKAEAEKNLADLRITVISEVRQAIAQLRAAQSQVVLQRANATLVLQNRDLVKKGYDAGKESLVRLNEAQRDLIKAQSGLVLALASLRQAWHNLKASTAENLETVNSKQ